MHYSFSSSPQWSIRKRFQTITISNQPVSQPGPSDYAVLKMQAQTPKIAITKEKRNLFRLAEPFPGPGAYQHKSAIIESVKRSAMRKQKHKSKQQLKNAATKRSKTFSIRAKPRSYLQSDFHHNNQIKTEIVVTKEASSFSKRETRECYRSSTGEDEQKLFKKLRQTKQLQEKASLYTSNKHADLAALKSSTTRDDIKQRFYLENNIRQIRFRNKKPQRKSLLEAAQAFKRLYPQPNKCVPNISNAIYRSASACFFGQRSKQQIANIENKYSQQNQSSVNAENSQAKYSINKFVVQSSLADVISGISIFESGIETTS